MHVILHKHKPKTKEKKKQKMTRATAVCSAQVHSTSEVQVASLHHQIKVSKAAKKITTAATSTSMAKFHQPKAN